MNVEEMRNKINLDIRGLLNVIDLIDGKEREYENYIQDSMSEIEFLEQQGKLIEEAKNRLMDIFKD